MRITADRPIAAMTPEPATRDLRRRDADRDRHGVRDWRPAVAVGRPRGGGVRRRLAARRRGSAARGAGPPAGPPGRPGRGVAGAGARGPSRTGRLLRRAGCCSSAPWRGWWRWPAGRRAGARARCRHRGPVGVGRANCARSTAAGPTARAASASAVTRPDGCLYAEQRHALVAFGPPQSGKSAGLAVPALLEWRRPRGRLLDQDRPARRDPRAPASARHRARVRSVRPRGSGLPHLVAAARRRHLGRRARGRVAAGGGRRARPARRRGRRLLGGRGRAAPGAAAATPRP